MALDRILRGFPLREKVAEFGRVMPRVQGARWGRAVTLDMAYVAAQYKRGNSRPVVFM